MRKNNWKKGWRRRMKKTLVIRGSFLTLPLGANFDPRGPGGEVVPQG
jgi:hypothetical protein